MLQTLRQFLSLSLSLVFIFFLSFDFWGGLFVLVLCEQQDCRFVSEFWVFTGWFSMLRTLRLGPICVLGFCKPLNLFFVFSLSLFLFWGFCCSWTLVRFLIFLCYINGSLWFLNTNFNAFFFPHLACLVCSNGSVWLLKNL